MCCIEFAKPRKIQSVQMNLYTTYVYPSIARVLNLRRTKGRLRARFLKFFNIPFLAGVCYILLSLQ